MLRGLLDVLMEIGSARALQVRRLIRNPVDVCVDEDEHFKLWPRRRDRSVWRVAMDDQFSDHEGHLYLQARKYFRDRAKEASRGDDGQDRSDVLVDAALSLFKIVVIDLEDNDDAQVIFEVLNGRQTALSASDLVKNLLFLRAERSGVGDLERLYEQHWGHFDDPWWREELGRGHATRGRRDVLLSSWLTATTAIEVNVGRLYAEVRGYLARCDRSISDVLTELSRYAEAFRTVIDADASLPKSLRVAYTRIDKLGVLTALPVLLWLRALPSSVLSPQEHALTVTALESWIVRRMLVGANTRGYGKRLIDVMKAGQAALDAGAQPGLAVRAALSDAPANMKWPTNEDVTQAFLRRPVYGMLNQGRVRLILGALDERMQDEAPKSEKATFTYDALQIEHILPQSWREHWPVPSGDALAEQKRAGAVDVIGNLTLVTEALNPSMSNAAWKDKAEALREHSKLHLNREVINLPQWDESQIDARAQRLALLACKVWPGAADLVGTGTPTT